MLPDVHKGAYPVTNVYRCYDDVMTWYRKQERAPFVSGMKLKAYARTELKNVLQSVAFRTNNAFKGLEE